MMKRYTRLPATFVLLLTMVVGVTASTGRDEWVAVDADNRGFTASFPVAPVVDEQSIELSENERVPVRIYIAGTPAESYVIASIGEFPFALDEAGKEFLKREFFEQFLADTMSMKSSEIRSLLKVKLLPQTAEKEQSCAFTFGEVSGQMRAVVAGRRVFMLCVFTTEVRNRESAADSAKHFFNSFRTHEIRESARLD